jgi:uncharacterized protein
VVLDHQNPHLAALPVPPPRPSIPQERIQRGNSVCSGRATGAAVDSRRTRWAIRRFVVNDPELISHVKRHPLLWYFLLAFGLTWMCHTLVLGILRLPFDGGAAGLGSFAGPTLAAFAVTALAEGKQGILDLLRRYVRWRVSPVWYLVALLGIPALFLLGVLVQQPAAIGSFRAPTLAVVLSSLAIYLHILVLGGPLGEEPGWRGFALPRLQRRFGPLRGTLWLGVLHGVWHLPLYLYVPGYNRAEPGLLGAASSFGTFLIGAIALSVVFTWMFNNTRGSLLPAILLHASINTAGMFMQLFPGISPAQPDLVRPVALVAVALVIVAATRTRLGYAGPAAHPEPANCAIRSGSDRRRPGTCG